MKKVLVMPVLAAMLFAAACAEDSGPTHPGTTGNVRFFNATTGMSGSSALAFGTPSSACSALPSGLTNFGFGEANSGGTKLSGSALATVTNQNVLYGGDFTVAAYGSAASPTLLFLPNRNPDSLSVNEAGVRVLNLAPGTTEVPNNYAVFKGAFENGGALIENNPEIAIPTEYHTVTSGANKFSLLRNHILPLDVPVVEFNLQAGSLNTLAIVPTGTGLSKLVHVQACS
jgi:hypothetical protein